MDARYSFVSLFDSRQGISRLIFVIFFFFLTIRWIPRIPFDEHVDLISILRAIFCLQFLLAVRKYLYRVNEMRSRKQIKFNVKDPFYVK